ncbi:MAG TPA: LCP family protein [Acidimicrobiales bacterium]|nr:LCP family protein [Acidimicrobiales bacterium]
MPKTRLARRALVGLNVAVAVALVTTSSVSAYVAWRLRQIDRVDIDGGAPESDPGGAVNILVVGSDSRAVVDPSERRAFGTEAQAGGKRTDTILVVRVDPRERRTAILSIPRDLWVPIMGTGSVNRVNAAFAGGPKRLVATVSNALDIPIDHYVELDFKTFRNVVDSLSGVDYYFATPVRDRYTGLDIRTPGCVHLDGNAALDLVRSRHHLTYRNGQWQEDPRQDFGRIERQQQFMRLVLRKALVAARNPLTLNSLFADVTADLTVDDEFEFDEMREMATRLRSLAPEDVEMLAVPATAGWAGNDSVVYIDEPAARPILERFSGRPPTVRAVTTTTTARRGRSTSTTAATAPPPTTTTTVASAAC